MKTPEQKAAHAAYMREYGQRPEVKERQRARRATPEYSAKRAQWRKAQRRREPERVQEMERAWRTNGREKLLAKKRRERQRRADKIREYNAAYMARNPELMRAWRKKWETKNPGLVRHGRIRRRAREALAVVSWADRTAMNEVYARCARVTRCIGIEFHVDHILPLRGRSVSGLHVPLNLRVIPAAENFRKANKVL